MVLSVDRRTVTRAAAGAGAAVVFAAAGDYAPVAVVAAFAAGAGGVVAPLESCHRDALHSLACSGFDRVPGCAAPDGIRYWSHLRHPRDLKSGLKRQARFDDKVLVAADPLVWRVKTTIRGALVRGASRTIV